MMTREQHMAWCKQRAHEYADQGDATSAVASMLSDIDKHPETKMDEVMAAGLGMVALMSPDRHSVKRWIDGFN